MDIINAYDIKDLNSEISELDINDRIKILEIVALNIQREPISSKVAEIVSKIMINKLFGATELPSELNPDVWNLTWR